MTMAIIIALFQTSCFWGYLAQFYLNSSNFLGPCLMGVTTGVDTPPVSLADDLLAWPTLGCPL